MFKHGIENNPDFELLRTNYAIFLETIVKDLNSARAQYESVLQTSARTPSLAETRANYAVLLYESLNDYQEAEKQFKLALQENRYSVFVHTSYAGFLFKAKLDNDQAEHHYKIAVHNDPFSAVAHHKYAVFLKNTRRSHTALCESHARSAAKLDSNKAEYWDAFLKRRDLTKSAETKPVSACVRMAEGDVAVLFGCLGAFVVFAAKGFFSADVPDS